VRFVAYLLISMALLIGAYSGWWYISRDARARDHADAFISIFGNDGLCDVQRQLGGLNTSMPCAKVGRYLREALNINRGGTVTIGAGAETSEATLEELRTSTKREGIRIVSILKVSISEPQSLR
jgi:hypothetical protein